MMESAFFLQHNHLSVLRARNVNHALTTCFPSGAIFAPRSVWPHTVPILLRFALKQGS